MQTERINSTQMCDFNDKTFTYGKFPSLNHFYNHSDATEIFIVDSSTQCPGCILQHIKRLHLL